MIVADTWKLGCPFESVSGINPLTFSDENEILYLTSTYADVFVGNGVNFNVTSNLHCTWHFVAPRGYKFKLVLIQRFFKESANLTITNDVGNRTLNIE